MYQIKVDYGKYWKLIKENENPKVDILVIEKGITFLVESEFV